jgi:hypothetical protein
MTNPSRSDSLIDVNRKRGFKPDRKEKLMLYTDGSKTKKVLKLDCIAMDQGGNLVLALGGTQRYSRQKCMSLRHAQ